jgi:hypothetical protein
MGMRGMGMALALLGGVYLGLVLDGIMVGGVQDEVAAETRDSIAALAEAVKELRLGDADFLVGDFLTEDQAVRAQEHQHTDSYPGTLKFSVGDIAVVVDENTQLILALYKRQENVRADDVTEMVGSLMARFGAPTTIAHDKILYWAWGPSGKIDAETFKKGKAYGQIDILATVKFNSSIEVTPGMNNDNTEETATIYYIITSDRLLERYVQGF